MINRTPRHQGHADDCSLISRTLKFTWQRPHERARDSPSSGKNVYLSFGKYVCLSLNTSGPRTVFQLLSFDIWQKLRQTLSDWSGETTHTQLGLSFHSNCFSLPLSSTHHVFKSDVSTCATKIIAFSFHCFHSVITDLHEPWTTTHRLPHHQSPWAPGMLLIVFLRKQVQPPPTCSPSSPPHLLPDPHCEETCHEDPGLAIAAWWRASAWRCVNLTWRRSPRTSDAAECKHNCLWIPLPHARASKHRMEREMLLVLPCTTEEKLLEGGNETGTRLGPLGAKQTQTPAVGKKLRFRSLGSLYIICQIPQRNVDPRKCIGAVVCGGKRRGKGSSLTQPSSQDMSKTNHCQKRCFTIAL